MGARAMWKARLVLGDAGDADDEMDELPVKLYAGLEDRQVHFNLLHRGDRVRVKQRMVHPDTGDEVPREERQKGLEVDRGVYVVLDEDELAALEPEASREIRVTRFVPPDRIDHRWYDSYLVAILAEGGILRAETLRYADEFRTAAGGPQERLTKPPAVAVVQ